MPHFILLQAPHIRLQASLHTVAGPTPYGCRHDQSLLSLIAKQHGVKSFPMPTKVRAVMHHAMHHAMHHVMHQAGPKVEPVTMGMEPVTTWNGA